MGIPPNGFSPSIIKEWRKNNPAVAVVPYIFMLFAQVSMDICRKSLYNRNNV
jgi:hypothetical protein